jgi:hypothetical protein
MNAPLTAIPAAATTSTATRGIAMVVISRESWSYIVVWCPRCRGFEGAWPWRRD